MLHKLIDAIFTKDASSPLKGYFQGVLEHSTGTAPTMDEARKDFHQLMHSQNPFASM